MHIRVKWEIDVELPTEKTIRKAVEEVARDNFRTRIAVGTEGSACVFDVVSVGDDGTEHEAGRIDLQDSLGLGPNQSLSQVCADTIEELVTEDELIRAFLGTNFGGTPNRIIVRQALLKAAVGWHQGYTSTCILKELGLLEDDYVLTSKGRMYLWLLHKEPNHV
ncbi:hypothetical protein HOT57_gp55 [Pseudomonas phage phCDa]|uniref:Uncharacterized protein n=1 Tax=Pseudomonas phage phCDa TaxID=2268587 RepID=A0A2Z5H974_9CAUD|nr:hypothetical protein HOT57_gp55 [Pseudomonas phage phCDa]AXC36499.1 hypothetical protein phCDa_55 [Pseudomonas phage phCDa]